MMYKQTKTKGLNKYKVFKLLNQLNIPAKSKTQENEAFIDKLLDLLKNIKGVKAYKDAYDNIIATKGNAMNYPAFCCHTDEVHLVEEVQDRKIMIYEGNIFAFDSKNKKQVGLGADDKAGIALCILLLKNLANVKCFFFSNEEVGGHGSMAIDTAHFENCNFLIELDRKGSEDAIIFSGGSPLADKDWVIDALGYTPSNNGVFTDVNNLRERGVPIQMLNLSVGYYNAHTNKEYLNINEFINSFNYCLLYAEKYTTKQEFVFDFADYRGYSYYDDYGYYYDDDDETYDDIDLKGFYDYVKTNYPYIIEDYQYTRNNFYLFDKRDKTNENLF